MTVTEVLRNSGLQVDHFNKPTKSPTKGDFARLINAVRDIESKQQESEKSTLEENADLGKKLSLVTARCAELERELAKLRLREELKANEAISIAQRDEYVALVSD